MHQLLYINWTVNPELVNIGPLTIRWYGLFFASAFLLGYYIMKKIFIKEGIKEESLDKILIYTMVGTIVGARLGHVLFYDFKDYLANPIDILKIWEGGLASHGAVIGISIALYIFSKKIVKKSLLWTLDRVVLTISIGACFVRVGNLMNHEIIGLPTTLPWAFEFTLVDQLPRHPAQLYEAFSYLIIFLILSYGYWKRNAAEKEGLLVGIFFVLVFGARFFIEFFKENQVAFEQGLSLNMGQLLSIPIVLLGFFLIFRAIKKTPAN